jgi:CRISPR-associated protein Csx10
LEGGLSSDKLQAALKEAPPPSDDKQASTPALHLGGETAGGAGAHWRIVRLVLDLSSPVVVPADTLGNMVTTHDHIPGSLLVPALNQWLRKLLGDRTTGALASGAVQVRNAYLAAGGRRLLPAPAALFKLKEGIETISQLHGPPDDKRQRKQVRFGFVATDGLPNGDKAALTANTVATTHATIDDDVQRPTSGVGGVYSYKALRPGQRLLSELWIDAGLIPTDVDFDNWLKQAPRSLRIGRAKKDDYGRVALTCQQITAPGKPTAAAQGLTLWLASPLLLRDEALSPVLNAHGVAEALTAALGVAVKVRNDGEGIFLRPWRDDGWNNAWQMRRPTRFGLAPGSCFAFDAEAKPSADALARVQAHGLGERRGEGYGEIVFNAPLLAEPPHKPLSVIELAADKPLQQPAGTLQPTEFSQALQRRAGRLAIRRKALEQDARFRETLGWRSGDAPLPPNTQLGALRALLESLHDVGGLNRIRSWLAATQNNDKRRDKWPNATIRTLNRHLGDDTPNSIWASLEMPGGPEPLANHNRETLAAELRIEAIKTLWLTAISRQLNANNRAQTVGSARQEASHGA